MFFGGGGRQRDTGPKKGESITHPITAKLEDLYNGKKSKLSVRRNVICATCNGKGGKEGCEKTCNGCSGRGVKVQIRQIGPGMISQSQGVCPDCKGQGKIINKEDRCKDCSGNKVTQEKKIIEVYIEKGMRDREKIVFSGLGDEAPGIYFYYLYYYYLYY